MSRETTSRRQLLRATALAGAALTHSLTAADAPPPETLVGSNIYGWTQYAARDKKPLNVEDVISALRDCGYDYLENFMNVEHPDENVRFADQLKAKGLQPVSLYVGARLHEAATAQVNVGKVLAAANVCRDAGFQVVSCNADPIGREKTDDELKVQAKSFADLGAGLARLNLKLGIHQHMPEMANGAREFHAMFDRTRPDEVGFCYDVHWVWKGGVQPMDALKQYGSRVVTWHLRQSRKGVWYEKLDTGDIDYAAVSAYAREHHLARRFTVELAIEPGTAITRSVVENHRQSREFVRQVFEA